MISTSVKIAFQKKADRNTGNEWEYPMYWAIDLHDVIIPGTYTRNNDDREISATAIEVLRYLTNKDNMCLILFTSSYEDSVQDILDWLRKEYKIKFNYVNENPEVVSNGLLNVEQKMYFDILLEDKAGFEINTDWQEIKNALIDIGEW